MTSTTDTAETKAWADAYGIAVIGASNTAAVARTIAATISALREYPTSRTSGTIDRHPAVRAMVAHLSYLCGIGLGPELDDLNAVIRVERESRLGLTNVSDIWHDDDGVWRQIGPQTFGPFATEREAEAFRPTV
jgi:hypothetical protein